MNSEQVEQMAQLEIACRFLYSALTHPPKQDFIYSLREDNLLNFWPVESPNKNVHEGLASMQHYLEGFHFSGSMQQLQDDFNALFIGPDSLKAAPWGSVYLSHEQLTFGESTLAVRRFYKKFNTVIYTGQQEPDDHLGLMLAFLSYLLQQGLQTIEQDEIAEFWLQACHEFLEEYTLTWSGRFLEIMKQASKTSFYQGVAALTMGTLEQLAALTGAHYRIVPLFR
ncbi:Tat proofreading chaperone DmsD [invertebrate metagenome]|uniref:Tat proofreading chaperone DmsD n=1 Tax=invertebrate metagenome TaxID=1711999 RepID=A0A2H9T5H9_9ZZZZ